MRIIHGTHGGRKINPPAQMPFTRPTTDIAKEGLFNMLQNEWDFEGLKTLDLFGGTGSISYELASRGATDLTIVEKDPKMFDFIKKNVEQFNFSGFHFMKNDVFKFIESTSEKYDIIFAGPPYALVEIDQLPIEVFKNNLLNEGGWFILEHTPRNNYKDFDHYLTERNYGTTIFSIFEQP